MYLRDTTDTSFLDGILKNIEIVSEIDIGTVEVPLKGQGTYISSQHILCPEFLCL